MNPALKIVTKLPLEELWTDAGPVHGVLGHALGENEIAHLLSEGPAQFVVANVGHPLSWIAAADRFRFWRKDVRPRLVRPAKGFSLEDYPDGYCYTAARWLGEQGPPIIVMQMHH